MIIVLGVNQKRICDFPLVINSNFGLSPTVFRDIDFQGIANGLLSPPLPCGVKQGRGGEFISILNNAP